MDNTQVKLVEQATTDLSLFKDHQLLLMGKLQALGTLQSDQLVNQIPLNYLAGNCLSLAQGLLKHHEVQSNHLVKSGPKIRAHVQSFMVAFIELLLISADSLKNSYNRSLSLTTDSNTSLAWCELRVSGTNIDFDYLERFDYRFIMTIFDKDQGSLSFEKNPFTYKISISFPRS